VLCCVVLCCVVLCCVVLCCVVLCCVVLCCVVLCGGVWCRVADCLILKAEPTTFCPCRCGHSLAAADQPWCTAMCACAETPLCAHASRRVASRRDLCTVAVVVCMSPPLSAAQTCNTYT
jgi:hypothetical protein